VGGERKWRNRGQGEVKDRIFCRKVFFIYFKGAPSQVVL
jgi:hypothetical protein